MVEALKMFGRIGLILALIAAGSVLYLEGTEMWPILIAAAYAGSGVFWWVLCEAIGEALRLVQVNARRLEQIEHEIARSAPPS